MHVLLYLYQLLNNKNALNYSESYECLQYSKLHRRAVSKLFDILVVFVTLWQVFWKRLLSCHSLVSHLYFIDYETYLGLLSISYDAASFYFLSHFLFIILIFAYYGHNFTLHLSSVYWSTIPRTHPPFFSSLSSIQLCGLVFLLCCLWIIVATSLCILKYHTLERSFCICSFPLTF